MFVLLKCNSATNSTPPTPIPLTYVIDSDSLQFYTNFFKLCFIVSTVYLSVCTFISILRHVFCFSFHEESSAGNCDKLAQVNRDYVSEVSSILTLYTIYSHETLNSTKLQKTKKRKGKSCIYMLLVLNSFYYAFEWNNQFSFSP